MKLSTLMKKHRVRKVVGDLISFTSRTGFTERHTKKFQELILKAYAEKIKKAVHKAEGKRPSFTALCKLMLYLKDRLQLIRAAKILLKIKNE